MNSASGTATAGDFRLRAMHPADIPFANELRRLARWNQTEADWRGYLDYEPAGCFVAEMRGAPVGTATTIRYDTEVGWIGMVVVHPAARGLGVGKRLLHHAIAYLKSCGVQCVKLDATPMGKKIYVPLGFRDEYEVTRYEGIAPVVARAGEPASEARPFSEFSAESIAAFDAAAFGAGRPAVLVALSRRNPDYCFAAGEAGDVRGYLVAREGSEAVQVGPWVARDPATARGLWHALARRIAGRRVFVDVPGPNTAGCALVEASGFTVQRGFTRMYLGQENLRPGDPRQIFGTGGAEKG